MRARGQEECCPMMSPGHYTAAACMNIVHLCLSERQRMLAFSDEKRRNNWENYLEFCLI